jgi:UDP-glucose 4-epimerase
MKILIVGGAGYIGSICAELLLDQGHEITVFDNLSEGHRGALDPRARFIEGDLQDRQAIDSALAVAPPEAVMHFAASALVSESMRDPSKYFRNNISSGLNLLDAMVAAHVERIVFSSTCAIFGPPDRLPIDEAAPMHPINPYGESKLAFEKILRWYDEIHGLKFVALRYFNAAGATANFGEDHRLETHLIPNVLKVALGQEPHVEIFGTDYETPDGTCIRDYIHVVDLAREKSRRAGDPSRLIASSEKIKNALGWRPAFQSLDAIIESAWNWHQKFPRGYRD